MYKKKFNSKNIAIIISSIGESYLENNLKLILNSSRSIGQIILCVPENCSISSNSKKILILKSKVKNQVIQRCLAKKYISKNIKLIFQLDPQFILKKSSINEILDIWNNQSDNVAGIGFIPFNYLAPKINLLQKILLTNSNSIGKVLSSGHVSAWKKNTRFKKVDWLHGGCVTWRYKYCSDIFNRKYPPINWSVAEDLIYSFRKSQKYNLLISNQVKLKTIKKNNNFTIKESYLRGYLHAKVIKNFVLNNKNLSIASYYYSMILSSFIGATLYLFFFDYKKSISFLGRFIGCLSKTYNFKII